MSNKGKIVTIHCIISKNGEIIDDTHNSQPLQFPCEYGYSVPGVISAVENMEVGQSLDITLTSVEGFGEYQESYLEEMPLSYFPQSMQPKVNSFVYLQQDGIPYPAKVTAIEDGIVKLDANHPLAGRTLDFSIELLSVEEPEEDATKE